MKVKKKIRRKRNTASAQGGGFVNSKGKVDKVAAEMNRMYYGSYDNRWRP